MSPACPRPARKPARSNARTGRPGPARCRRHSALRRRGRALKNCPPPSRLYETSGSAAPRPRAGFDALKAASLAANNTVAISARPVRAPSQVRSSSPNRRGHSASSTRPVCSASTPRPVKASARRRDGGGIPFVWVMLPVNPAGHSGAPCAARPTAPVRARLLQRVASARPAQGKIAAAKYPTRPPPAPRLPGASATSCPVSNSSAPKTPAGNSGANRPAHAANTSCRSGTAAP